MTEQGNDNFNPGRYGPASLFAERAAAFWIAVWKCWRTVLDWTVLLYIVLPGAFIAVGMYRDFMRDPPSGLTTAMLIPIFGVMALLQLAGKFRTFAERGDALFLHRLPKWKQGFGWMGFAYGLACRLLTSAVAVAVASPLLLQTFNISETYTAILIVFFAACGSLWTMVEDRVSLRWKGWRRIVIQLLLRIAFAFVFVRIAYFGEEYALLIGSASVAIVVLAAALLRLRIRKNGTLLHEIAVENNAYVSSVSLILRDTLEKKPVPGRRRPMWFAQSQPLFRHRNGADKLADSWVKSVLRRSDLWKHMLYFLGAGTAAIALTPLALAVIVWLVLPALLLLSLQRQWEQWLAEPYVALFTWQEDLLEQASRKGKLAIAAPIVAAWALLVGVKFGMHFGGEVWAAVVLIPVASYFWLRKVNDMLSSFSAMRRKKE
ncbi:ABC transporter permease [Cohnella terricola]|nr:ABC transporter permease [Cohnella terricola]